MAILARLNTNGQAISVSKALMPRGARLDAAPLKSAFAARQGSNKVAMTFRDGTHDLWLRYWLAAGGIDPDREVETIVVPPPQMVANMKVGTTDALCVGEPWNDQLVHQGLGDTACVTGEMAGPSGEVVRHARRIGGTASACRSRPYRRRHRGAGLG